MSANLYRRGKVWYGRIQVAGRDVRRSLMTESEVTARKRLAVMIGDARAAKRNLPAAALRRTLLEALARNAPRASRGHFVYFAQAERGGAIKIGRSNNPQARLAALQVGSRARLRLIASVSAPAEIEGVLHERFAADRLDGEWFRSTPRLRRFIADLSARQMAQSATVRVA